MIPIQDRNVPLTPEDLRQRYNLEEVGKIKSEVLGTQNNLRIIDNELQSFKNATIDQLQDLNSQVDGKIVTWFFNGIPTLLNNPTIDWTTNEIKDKHINDLYFDKETGYVYYFIKVDGVYKWERNKDQDVTTAMSTANSAKDTADNKRQVFTDTPNPPYDIGDLWTKSTGELKSCKLSKSQGESFNENDWEDAMTKLKGEVETLGGNKIITDIGVYANLQFNIDRFDLYGHEYLGVDGEMIKKPMDLHIMIPNNYSITEAKITVYHAPINWNQQYPTVTSGWGYIRSLRAYKVDTSGDFYVPAVPNSFMLLPEFNSVEIIGAMGSSGYTPPTPNNSNKKIHIYTSNDIKNSLTEGLNIIRLQPHDDLSIGSEDPGLTKLKYSGYCYAVINILGYQK